MVPYLETSIEELPPLNVPSKSFVHIEHVLQRVSGNIKRSFQPDWYLIHAFLDVLARLRIESHAPAFQQNHVQRSIDRCPPGLGETIPLTAEQTFVKARDAYFARSRAIYFLQQVKNGETEGDIVSAREAASAEKWVIWVRSGESLQLGMRKVEVIDRKRG
jgi:hypothetical protein